MVAALQDQKIHRRNNRDKSGEIRSSLPGNGFRKKNRFLTFLFSLTIMLLLVSSIVFSLATLDSNHKSVPPKEAALNEAALSDLLDPGNAHSANPATDLNSGRTGNLSDNIIEEHSGQNRDLSSDAVLITRNEVPPVHIVKPGNTIYEISRKYHVSLYELILYNKIHDPARLQVNDKIYIPQGNEKLPDFTHPVEIKKGSNLPQAIEIEANVHSGHVPLTVNFRMKAGLAKDSLIYIWDFGNDKFAFTREGSTTYTKVGDYRVFLMVSDQENNEVISNKLTIRVNPPRISTAKITRTSNTDYYYLTAGQNDVLDFRDYLDLESGKTLFGIEGTKIEQTKPLLIQTEPDKFLTVNAGYALVRISNGDRTFKANLFVSPFPSRNSFEPPYDWYKTQFKTGFNGNCGPACVAMAIHWAKADNVSVKQIRDEIGMPIKSGAIGFNHMFGPFRTHKTNAFYSNITSKEDFFRIVDRGNIAIFVYHTGKISKTAGNKTTDFVGRYYPDTTGHYSIIKGYTLDKRYFIVYDPIPGDWRENTVRYSDGESMLGRNRYYLVDELMSSLRDSQVVEVSRG